MNDLCWGCWSSSECWGCWGLNSNEDFKMGKVEELSKIVVQEGIQDLAECQASIMTLGRTIGDSDMTSTFINEQRLLSMRTILDLFENYNNQLKVLREE